jgi:hypothetical protein
MDEDIEFIGATQRDLIEREGRVVPDLPPGLTRLEQWQDRILDVPLSEYDVNDLAICCREGICLKKLNDDLLAGELYEGELAASLANIPSSYWVSHPNEAAEARKFAVAAAEFGPLDEIRSELRSLAKRLSAA